MSTCTIVHCTGLFVLYFNSSSTKGDVSSTRLEITRSVHRWSTPVVVQSCVIVTWLQRTRTTTWCYWMRAADRNRKFSHKLDSKLIRWLMTTLPKCIQGQNHVNSTRYHSSRAVPKENRSGASIPASAVPLCQYMHVLPSSHVACEAINVPPLEPNISFESSCTQHLDEDQLQDLSMEVPLPRNGSLKTHRRSTFMFIGWWGRWAPASITVKLRKLCKLLQYRLPVECSIRSSSVARLFQSPRRKLCTMAMLSPVETSDEENRWCCREWLF